MANDTEITEQLERAGEIIQQLDADECGCDEGEALYEEGPRLLAEVRDRLNDGNGDIVDRE